MASPQTHETKASDFLAPTERKYQYKKDGKVSGSLLRAAIADAQKDKNAAAFEKGSGIFNDMFVQ